ncbi:MAG: FAD-binding protein [Pseudolabrys sp.]|nr:FAD-binding protein [Pseudolabrys sp.]
MTVDTVAEPASPTRFAAAIADLTAAFGNRVVTSRAVREQHGNTVTWIANEAPDAVIYPQSTEDVQQVVRICAKHKMPIIPFGTGSSLEGHVNAPQGGVSIDFRDMNKLITVHAEDLDCVVQPGITRKELNEQLRDSGLFFPIDPGANASLGGMASTRASGTNAVRYGTMKDNVLTMKVVLANGEVIDTARRAKKTSAGYDLTRLMVGSEGTLGIITELTLKLSGIPEAISGGRCPFPSVEAACNATILTIQSGIPVARIELLDALQVKALNLGSNMGLPETTLLLMEFHGTDASVKEQAERFGDIAAEFGGGPFVWTAQAEERTKLWEARHNAAFSNFQLRPGAAMIATDVCVPISRLAECVTETQADVIETGMVAPIVGHVGDGNFHLTLLVDLKDADEVKRVKALSDRLVKRALAMDGTATGEHGVGQGKMKYMELEHGAAAVAAMRAIKQALDPQNILNPGKLLPAG